MKVLRGRAPLLSSASAWNSGVSADAVDASGDGIVCDGLEVEGGDPAFDGALDFALGGEGDDGRCG